MKKGVVTISLVVLIAWVVAQDINKKMQNEIRMVKEQILECERNYFENECHPDTRPPALMDYCSEQETCMNQNAEHVVRSSHMFAQMIADVLNGLISGLELKTILVFLGILFGYHFLWDHLNIFLHFRLVFIASKTINAGYSRHYEEKKQKNQEMRAYGFSDPSDFNNLAKIQ